ncbi:putative sodium/sulfate transporter, DASS family [Prochlorococcus marinus subsp. pastoris str. CCMP1986]|uniref:Putative sodium/sulfate transporter, DASS family n=1 Tax=Prochlorococcus marinus subsp. pastoris (strain CCMP1986 / NIES-2087 / MED4) TaxID=59919 RepID=Q7V3J2_PROMP|nr:SLC13 family permease [Prochlorococcus marinus]KGF88166.1 Sulfate permease [Prochlorococcus marinus str. EQPAC1]CAE18542.1 putative sodium/sulfate transporter, DASS family [Prochlorococcus marinus subsp. pastoris str. CCMP1986]
MNLISFFSNNLDALITVLVLFLSLILFIKNTIAPELTGLLCVGIFIVTGVLTPEKALSGFGSPSLITLMGLFAVSSALFKSGALDRVRELISSENIKTPRKLILLITFLIAPISGIVPNTPVVASLLPLIEGWCERRNISPSKVLLPLSFATLLGGTLTLLGSSVNLLVSDISQQLGYGSLELFSLTSIGIPVWLIGTTYMILVSDVLLPDRGRNKDFIKNGNMNIYFTEVTIPSSSELVGQSVRNSRLQRRFDVDVLELQRNGKVILPPLADRKFEPEDRLIVRVTRADLLRLQQEHTILLAENKRSIVGTNLLSNEEGTKTFEALLPSGSTLAGASLRELRFRQRHNATVLALRRGQQTVQERLGQAVLRAGDVLLLQAPLDSIRGLQASNDLLILDQFEDDLPFLIRKPIAIAIAIGMVLLPALTNIPLVGSVLLAVIAMVAFGCLRPAEIQRSIRLDIILLLGSLSSFSVAMQVTGLADLIAINLDFILSGMPLYFALIVIFISTVILTQFISNAASVALILPVAIQFSSVLGISPNALIMLVLFGASQSFLTPMGYQTNLMVYGPGRYRFFDIAKYGAGLTLIMSLIVPALIILNFK